MSNNDEITSLERVPTGVPGLDAVLHGGLLQAGCYLILGKPGAGKTILGSQIAFHHVAAGGRATYLTLLTESHARLLAHLQSFSFFDPDVLTKSLSIVSGYQELEKDKLKGLLALIRRVVKEQKSTLLIVDGVATADLPTEAEIEFKKFLYELKFFVEMAGCTMLLLTGTLPTGAHYPAQTMVDGIIDLTHERVGMRSMREVEVVKSRGSPMLGGAHFFEITDDGIIVHPRIEAAYKAKTATVTGQAAAVRLGVSSLDSMLGGGLSAGSTTLVLGSPGSGKTLLSLQFLAQGAKENQPGIHLGFQEEPARLVSKAAGIGIDLTEDVAQGTIQVIWKAPFELIGDQVAEELLGKIRRHKVKRVVLDGIEGFIRAQIFMDRAVKLLSALAHELRVLGATTLFTQEAFPGGGQDLELPRGGETGLADNILLLRHIEQRFRLRRLISVLKKREGAYDSSVHEFFITGAGLEVTPMFDGDEQIAKGTVGTVPSTARKASSRPATSGKLAPTSRAKRKRR